MQVVELHQAFPYPLERVIAAREYRYENPGQFPEMSHLGFEKFERTEHSLITVRHLSFGERIPSFIRAMLPAEMFTMREEACYNYQSGVFDILIYPPSKPAVFRIEGQTAYFENAGQCYRNPKISFTVNLPVGGRQAESHAAAGYRHTLETDRSSIIELIEANRV